ncbi:MAG TPA: dethiobiotin synthase [Polyangia bacterium]
MTSAGRRRGLFVTGTDTGVGKTLVSAALLRYARRLGLVPIPFKPAETGCASGAADARVLWRAAAPPIAEADVCLYPLHLPIAPAAAAEAEGVRIDLERIADRADTLAAKGDLLIVEGAGGLLVPYDRGATGADLAKRLGLPLLVVARTALGTVNHTALTLREAARTRVPVAGLILNRTPGSAGPQEAVNAALIASLTGCQAMGTFPTLGPEAATDPDRLADALTAAVPERALRALLGLEPETSA